MFYFTELMALVYGLPAGKVLAKHLTDPRPVLRRAGVVQQARTRSRYERG